MNAFDPIRERLAGMKEIVFVTGAGVSQESGIPTFRGRDGLWRNHDAMKLATIDAFHENPKLVWEWYEDRRRNIFGAEPNGGHTAIADLEEFASVSVLTQNIDGLHQRAGSTNVLELHGSIVRVRCTVCDYKKETKDRFPDIPPLCSCGGILRPDVVWFGESLPEDVWRNAMVLAGRCDLMVVVGTSLAVSPANMLPSYAKRGKALVVEVNPERTGMSDEMDLVISETGATALPGLVSAFGS